MESICIKARLRENKLDRVRKWFNELKTRLPEVMQTLQQEGVIVEAAFLDLSPHGDYLIYYLKAESIQKAYDVFRASLLPIDVFYRNEWISCCEGRQELEILLDLDRIGSVEDN